jgi:hypothetical protein
MNDRFLKLTGISFAGFLVLLAVNGKALTDAMMGFPALVQAWSAVLPLGVWSAVLALVVAVGAWAFAMRYLHPRPDGRSPQLGADIVAILMGIAVTVTQASGGGANAGRLLSAMWMGCAVGFLAPVVARMIASITSRVSK